MPARKAASLPQSTSIPKGMKQMGGGYAPTWKPEKEGDNLHGKVHAPVKTVEFTQKRKVKGKMTEETVERRVVEIASLDDGKRHALWESAALVELFDALANEGENAVGTEVFIQYDGLGKKKAGQNPPKLFTVAMAA